MTLLEDGDPEIGENRVKDLMDVVDSYIPQQERLVDRSFLMPTKDVFSISGRGMVVTGRVERGVVSMGDEVEIVDIRPTTKTAVTGVEISRKPLDRGEAGDNLVPSFVARSVKTSSNTGAFIEQAVYSILNQPMGSLEVIIVNDASLGDTREKLLKLPKSGQSCLISQPQNSALSRTHYTSIR
ncbi:hypothetical protein A0U92_07445 [Acetobacter aceti]|uniref:Translation elongation factor EFTu-like domain-containing protein n=1 Tax=Acetobacter aceti TaxID=435 RepID=A0A1U9KFQ9_ACEAC|nr:hypothetical protein A0U92_07445 [Acetobacter aceti]